MRRRCFFLLCFVLAMTPASRSAKSARPPADSAWIEKTLKKMSLEEKLGQMLVVYYFGEFTSTESSDYQDLVDEVEKKHVGGFILGTRRKPLGIERGGVYAAAGLGNQMQKRAK